MADPLGNQALFKQMNQNMVALNKMGVCDAACQKRKSIERKKSAWVTAQNDLKNAPINLERAERAYFTEAKGYPYYTQILINKHKKKAQDRVKSWNNDLWKPILRPLNAKLKYYKTQHLYKQNIGHVYHEIQSKTANLKEEVEETLAQKKVNDRLAYFYDYNTNIIDNIMWYLKGFYWILVTVSLILFFWKRQYRQIRMYPFLITVLLMPFILSQIYIFTMDKFSYFIINNIYFIFFTLIIGIIILFETVTGWPWRSEPA